MNLETTLQKYFGYSSFRPLQKEIISDILDKKDVFVLMPTGAGKSLCYQIPTLVQGDLTIVVSPLISLMKDQVDGLKQNGIAAAYFNSTLTLQDQQEIKEQLKENKITILYVAPERLMQKSFYEFIKTLPIALFAIDESHCISEWGHDFRKEYRMLSALKKDFPKVPIAALTATATERVQGDIVSNLNIHHAKRYVDSFNRPNLHYEVREKRHALDQILLYLQNHPRESGIIYCQSRDNVEMVAKELQRNGIKALPYHAGLEDKIRHENQEKFIREDIDVIVATIAFGMGIDKPNVRFVIHYSLPKNLESYYQETGRAGRDGLQSTCILFFGYGDTRAIEFFINQKESEHEQEIARQLLYEMIRFAETKQCRRKVILEYFGEVYDKQTCEGCDNCMTKREIFDGTIISQKILSCVFKLQKSFGIVYIARTLEGSRDKRILANGHDQLSTYGIIQDYSRQQIKELIRELVSQGYLKESNDLYHTISLTNKAAKVLKGKEKIFLTKPEEEIKSVKISSKKSFQFQQYDQELFELLRKLRKKLADKQNVPPYIIFSDVSLQDMSTYYPQTIEQFREVGGVGRQKLELYGKLFISTIKQYCEEKGIQPRARLTIKRQRQEITQTLTTRQISSLFHEGLTISQLAKKRGVKETTIIGHLIDAYSAGDNFNVDFFVSKEKQKIIINSFRKLGIGMLRPVKEELGEEYSYEDLRWVRAMIMKKKDETQFE